MSRNKSTEKEFVFLSTLFMEEEDKKQYHQLVSLIRMCMEIYMTRTNTSESDSLNHIDTLHKRPYLGGKLKKGNAWWYGET